jgi:hypothetical protein
MRWQRIVLMLLLAACSKDPAGEAVGSASAVASASAPKPAAFDIDRFCEQAMALGDGRKCDGDDEIIEGNKVGFCTTVLRAASDSGRISFDEPAASRCLAAVKTAEPALPDRRTLTDMGARFAACRAFIRGSQKKDAACEHSVECEASLYCEAAQCTPRAAAGESCKSSDACVHGLVCQAGQCSNDPLLRDGAACQGRNVCTTGSSCQSRASKRVCTPKKKAGDSCGHSDDCLGRCSRAQGRQCVSYCGSG